MEEHSTDEVDVSKVSANYNVTAVALTCNTNMYINTQQRYNDFIKDMKTLFFGPLSKDYRVYLFGPKTLVRKVEATHFGIEVGHKQLRGHVNITYFIYHHVAKYSVGKLNRRFKVLLDRIYPYSKGWHVYSKLLPFYQANYSNKEERHEVNNQVADDQQETEDFQRLSDNRIMTETYVDGELKYKLQSLSL